MRPALLVVIMDFLVSSLLLFVSGPGSGWIERRHNVAAVPPPAEEFASVAVAEMERQWQAEYREQLRDRQLLNQQAQLNRFAESNQNLQRLQERLHNQIALRESQLEVEQQQRVTAETRKRELESDRDLRQAEARELEQQLENWRRRKSEWDEEQSRLERQKTEAQSDRQAAQESARNLRAGADELSRKLVELRSRLQTQAGTIGDQHRTIASQQQVIDQSLQEMTLMQTRLESKTDRLNVRQTETHALLRELQSLAEKMPDALRESARELALEQQRLNETVRGLASAAAEAAADDLDQDDRNLVLERLGELAAIQEQSRVDLQALLERGETAGPAPELKSELQTVRLQQTKLQEGVSDLASRLEEMQTRQIGPFERLREACLPVETVLYAVFGDVDEPTIRNETFSNTAYAPLLRINGVLWLVLHGRDLGLEWMASASTLQVVDWQARTRAGTEVWSSDAGSAGLLPDVKALVGLACGPAKDFDEEAFGIRPLELIGRAGLTQRGTRDLFLVKRQADGAAFAVEAAPDHSDSGYLKVRRALRPWANFVARRLWLSSQTQAEPGDFLVTAEGQMVGAMVNDQRCWVLDESDFSAQSPTLPLNNPAAMRNILHPLRRLYK